MRFLAADPNRRRRWTTMIELDSVDQTIIRSIDFDTEWLECQSDLKLKYPGHGYLELTNIIFSANFKLTGKIINIGESTHNFKRPLQYTGKWRIQCGLEIIEVGESKIYYMNITSALKLMTTLRNRLNPDGSYHGPWTLRKIVNWRFIQPWEGNLNDLKKFSSIQAAYPRAVKKQTPKLQIDHDAIVSVSKYQALPQYWMHNKQGPQNNTLIKVGTNMLCPTCGMRGRFDDMHGGSNQHREAKYSHPIWMSRRDGEWYCSQCWLGVTGKQTTVNVAKPPPKNANIFIQQHPNVPLSFQGPKIVQVPMLTLDGSQ